LVIRGRCQFDDKVRNAQNAGFKAAVVYDNEDNGVLVSSNDSDIIFFTIAVTCYPLSVRIKGCCSIRI